MEIQTSFPKIRKATESLYKSIDSLLNDMDSFKNNILTAVPKKNVTFSEIEEFLKEKVKNILREAKNAELLSVKVTITNDAPYSIESETYFFHEGSTKRKRDYLYAYGISELPDDISKALEKNNSISFEIEELEE